MAEGQSWKLCKKIKERRFGNEGEAVSGKAEDTGADMFLRAARHLELAASTADGVIQR